MKKKIWKRLILAALGLVVIGAIVLALLPKPVAIETAKVGRGDLRVVIEAEGRTRVHDRYLVAAPVSGRLARVALTEGDRVAPGAPLASVYPSSLDAIQREELQRRIESAASALRGATVMVEQASAWLSQAERDRDRMRELGLVGSVSRQDIDRAEDAVVAASRELEGARFRAQGAAAESAAARAGRMALAGEHAVVLRSPAAGTVLRIMEKSERMVPAGTPLLEVGDRHGLEVVVDILSSDAVKVRPGATVLLDGWGGEDTLRARVRYVEPAAFTKVSALGVEEQRVNVVAELADPATALGDGYRVEARIVLWEGRGVLLVPTSALFRDRGRWSVFVVEDGRARLHPVTIGRMGPFQAELLGGAAEGSEVIVHPPDEVADGVGVEVLR